jgi:endonuclease/exonuclease/phosphatase family metal-dependent hydrolase
MAGNRSLFRILLVLINIGIIVAYLISCLAPFVNTGEDWLLAFPGLVFPLIFFSLVFFILLWTILRSRWAWISLIVLFLGFQQIKAVFAFNLPKNFSYTKNPNTLRIFQWNVSGWDSQRHNTNTTQPRMMELIKKQDADILCFEEFFEPPGTSQQESNITIFTKMGYPYHYFIPSVNYENDYTSGVGIFSRYPMIDSAKFDFNTENRGEHLLYVDIKVNDKIFRIFATHLQSVHFVSREYESLSKLKRAQKSGLKDSRTIVSKLKKGYQSRYAQATLVSEKIRESPYPSLICGDFNDVPNSSAYFRIRGNFQDAFLEKGTFLGRTFRFISPTLRIDYILADKKFTVTQYQRIRVPYSDHFPVETDLQY